MKLVSTMQTFKASTTTGTNKVAKKLGVSSDTGQGYRTIANISTFGGQEVPHLHFHLLSGENVGKMTQ